jgi:hypothetical protein
LFLVSASGSAFTNSKTSDLPQKTSSVISIKIDLGDITNLNENDIAALIDKNLVISLPDLPVLQCAITVEATFNIGVMSFRASVTVSGDCSEVKSKGKALALQIINEVRSYLEEYF